MQTERREVLDLFSSQDYVPKNSLCRYAEKPSTGPTFVMTPDTV